MKHKKLKSSALIVAYKARIRAFAFSFLELPMLGFCDGCGGKERRRAFVESALSESCGIGAAILVIAKMAESVKGLR